MAEILQFSQMQSAGRIQQAEAETAAKQEELAVIQREADRKQNLARALASQTASAGAKGISAFEGSPLAVLQADIDAEETATERDEFQGRLSAMTTRARGNIARQQMKAGATTSLIGGLTNKALIAAPMLKAGPAAKSPFISASNPLGLTPGQGL